MDNSSPDNQNMELQALAHEVCRNHSRPDRDLYRICPSKLSKRELEDLYFALLENNQELKRTINSQNDKLKLLSTKVQRLSANKTPGSKDKDCCHSKTLINEHKDSITELKKCNERMSERIRVLNMRLSSAKQFLKKPPPEQKSANKNQSKNLTSFQRFKNICDNHTKPHQPAIEYKVSKSVGTSPDNPMVTLSPKAEMAHECNENRCKTAIEELQQKIRELQEELHLTQYNYASKLHNLENEIRSVMDENVRARADSRALEERGDDLVSKLRAAEGRGDDLETELAIEKRKVKELETRLKHVDSDKNIAKSLDHLTVINVKRDSDISAHSSFKIRPRQSISESQKKDSDLESAVSYYKAKRNDSEISIKTVKGSKRGDPEVESVVTVSSQKSYRKDSQPSVKIKVPKRDDSEIESVGSVPSHKSYRKDSQTSVKIKVPKRDDSEIESVGSVPSHKSYRKDSQTSVKIKDPKHGEPEVESVVSVPSQKSFRKDSQASVKIKEPKHRHSKVEPEFLENELKEGPSSKAQRKQSIAEPKHRHSKVEPKIQENELKEGPSLKGQRKPSISETKHRHYKVEPEILENELKEGPSKGQRKPSISEPKHRDSKVEPEILENELKEGPSLKGQRKPSISEPKHRHFKVEPEILENELKEGPSKGQRKPSISQPKHRHSKVEPEILENELREGPSSKVQRIQSITEPKHRDSKVEAEIIENELREGPSSKGQRKQSITEPKHRDSKVEPEIIENELREGPSSKGQRKQSITEPKHRDSKVEPEILENELKEEPSSRGQRKQSDLEVKPSHEVSYTKQDDSGYIDPNKSFDVEPKDEEMLRINRDLLKKIADLKTQLDLLVIAAAGARQDEPEQSKPYAESQNSKRSSTPTAEVPNIIEPKQVVEAKTEDNIEETLFPSSVKPEVVQNADPIPKQLPNEDNLLKQEIKEKPFNKNVPETNFSSENLIPPLVQKQSLSEEKSPLPYEDQMEQPIPYEIRVPRSSLYPEQIQKLPQINQEVKSKPNEERDAIPSSYEDMPKPFEQTIPKSSTNEESKKQESLLLDGIPLSSYEVIAQRPWASEENLLMLPNNASKQQQKKSSPYEHKIHKSTLHEDKILIPEEKLQHKEYVDKKRESLFYKDEASDVDVVDQAETPNVNKKRDSLFDDMHKTNLPFEDKIYPEDQKSLERLGTDTYIRPGQDEFLKKRNPSLYAEQIQKFSFEGSTTSSPYEEKMKKLHDDKKHSEDDTKSIRFESYIHMAENSKEYGPEFTKYEETLEDDPEKRRRSSTIGTSKADTHNGFQIPGPIPPTPEPTPIDRKKRRNSIDKTKKGVPEEKTVKIFEDDNPPSGYSIYIDKNDSTAASDYFDAKKNKKPKGISISDVDFHNKPRVSTDFSQVTDNPKEIKDMYQNTSYNSKTPQVQSYFDMVGEGDDIPPTAMQEQGTQISHRIENLQGPVGAPRRDSATYTQTDKQPQTYTVPKDASTEPKPETLDQKTYTQDGTQEYVQTNAYKRDTYVHNAYNHNNYPQVGPQNAQTPRYSRSTSPDNTEKEISSLSDLPQEKEIKPTQGYLSPGEKATMTFTDNETNTDYGSLSEGELPSTKKVTKSFGEKGVETISRPEESPTQRMEDVLQSISEELARCHQLLASQKRDENFSNSFSPHPGQGSEHNAGFIGKREVKPDDGVQLRASQGASRLSGSHHVCVFTLHIGTLVLSDEAIVLSRDKSLVLTWRFFESSVTMTRMRAGRVVLFDFSTEYDVVCSEDFINYMKYEKMPLLICEISKHDKPFATCSLPLRDALLHVNRRADMSLALTGGDVESSSEEFGVLDLWCILRCDAAITQHLSKSMARPSTANMSNRRCFHRSMVEEESNDRMSEDMDLNIKKDSRAQNTVTNQMPMNNKKSSYIPNAAEAASQPGEPGLTAVDDLSTSTGKMSRRKRLQQHSRLNIEKKDVSFDGNWIPRVDTTELIANAVPSNIRSTEEMKAAVDRNAKQEENWKMPKMEDKALSRKNQLSKLKFTKNLSEDAIADSLQDLISNRTSEGKSSQPKYDLPPEKIENNLSKKYNDISKLMGSRMDVVKKSVKYYSDEEEQPQRIQGVQKGDPSPQSIEITVLWLALNEECDAMVNPDIKRLYVAYKFLGRNGAELETPVSLPKPKHYVDKCFFNFKKTFHLHDADLPALGHMARVRADSRVSTDPRDCLVFTVVSEPPEDPLGLANCEDVGYAYLYLGDILAYSSGSGAYTEVVAVHAARGSAVCGVLAVKIDGLHVLRRALTLSYSAKDLTMAY